MMPWPAWMHQLPPIATEQLPGLFPTRAGNQYKPVINPVETDYLRARLSGAPQALAPEVGNVPLGPKPSPFSALRARITPAQGPVPDPMTLRNAAGKTVVDDIIGGGKVAATASKVGKIARVAGAARMVGKVAKPLGLAIGAYDVATDAMDPTSGLRTAYDADNADVNAYLSKGERLNALGAMMRRDTKGLLNVAGTMTGIPAVLSGAGKVMHGMFGSPNDVAQAAVAPTPAAANPALEGYKSMPPAPGAHAGPSTMVDPIADIARAYPNMTMSDIVQMVDMLPKTAKNAPSPKDIAGFQSLEYYNKQFNDMMRMARTPAERAAISKEWLTGMQGIMNPQLPGAMALWGQPDDNR